MGDTGGTPGGDPAEVRGVIVKYLLTEVAPHLGVEELSDDANLVEDEVIDSLGIFSLVGFIEERYGVEIDIEELTLENFESVPAITGLVTRTLSGGS